MPTFCNSCGATIVGRGAFCSACGARIESYVKAAPQLPPRRRSALQQVFTPIRPSEPIGVGARNRSRVWALLGFGFLLVLVIGWSTLSDNDPGSDSNLVSTAQREKAPFDSKILLSELEKAPTIAPPTKRDDSKDVRADGRIYSVALIVDAPEIPVGGALFAQGRVASLAYASGMRSRRLAVIEANSRLGRHCSAQ
jgi:hypothetical protein